MKLDGAVRRKDAIKKNLKQTPTGQFLSVYVLSMPSGYFKTYIRRVLENDLDRARAVLGLGERSIRFRRGVAFYGCPFTFYVVVQR